ncbi:MAG: Crp/Fnr family transcriptional regulator [Pyrinomonadaceae bacterium]|nr:Crp/Fnr family transcriptional regulator [Pyrinomonadaceae bacterium]
MPVSEIKNAALKNHLLAALPKAELAILLPNFDLISFTLGDVLYESGEQMNYVYFPSTAIVSLLYIMENGSTAEIGIIGNDGVVGVSLFMGGKTTTSRAIIQSAGTMVRLKDSVLQEEFSRGGKFQELLLRYTQALMTQISQTAVCNRLHSIEQQLCRWLLLSHDRLDTNKLIMTHDLISNMLGVRREGVTLAAQKLAAKKLITNDRGTMIVIDRPGLEAAVCECYKVVFDEYVRLLGENIFRQSA